MSTIAVPFFAFPHTTEAVTTVWHEVAADYDGRPMMPRVAAIAAVNEAGQRLPFAGWVELMLPGGGPMQMSAFDVLTNLLVLNFPCKWRIAKPVTETAISFVVYGYGETGTIEE